MPDRIDRAERSSNDPLSFENIVITRLNELVADSKESRKESRETKELLIKYAERVDGMSGRLGSAENLLHEHSVALAAQKEGLSSMQKLLAALGSAVAALIGGVVLYYFTHH